MKHVALLLVLVAGGCATTATSGPCEAEIDGGGGRARRMLAAFVGVGQSVVSDQRAAYYACKRDASTTPQERAEWEGRRAEARGEYVAALSSEQQARDSREERELAERQVEATEAQTAAIRSLEQHEVVCKLRGADVVCR